MQELISTFHIDKGLLIAQVINFALVFFVLYKMAVKPLKKVMSERHTEITKGLEDAKTNEETLKKTQEGYDKAIREARKEAQSIIEEAKKSALTEKDAIVAAAKSESDNIIRQGKIQLEQEKDKMIRGAKNELADIVLSATEKVLEGVMTKPIDRKLVEEALSKK